MAMNNDVCTEILLQMPVRSLLRFRAVCKFWCYVIDSASFRKLHIDNNKSNDDMYLWFSYDYGHTVLGHNEKWLVAYKADHHNFSMFNGVKLYGPVKGLICTYGTEPYATIHISNPCLRQVKLLPASSYSGSCSIIKQEVAIGFDEDYKVVQLMECNHHYRLHALLYTRKTNSWRELAVLNGDEKLGWVNPIKSRCENGRFAHWHVFSTSHLVHSSSHPEELILSLDMKNEVFRTIRLWSFGPRHCCDPNLASTYFAEDEHSFWRFDLPHSSTNTVNIYRSSFEVSFGALVWNRVTDVVNPFNRMHPPQWRMTDCVVFVRWMNEFMFDYRAR